LRPFFSHPALIAVAAVLGALSGAAFFAGGSLSPGVREDRGNRWVLAPFMLIGFLNAYLPAYTDRKELWTIDGDMVRWLGVVLFAAGGALRIWPVFVLGNRFSGLVAIQPGHTLVTNGVYRVIRHPSYVGLLVNSLDLGTDLESRSLAPPESKAESPLWKPLSRIFRVQVIAQFRGGLSEQAFERPVELCERLQADYRRQLQ